MFRRPAPSALLQEGRGELLSSGSGVRWKGSRRRGEAGRGAGRAPLRATASAVGDLRAELEKRIAGWEPPRFMWRAAATVLLVRGRTLSLFLPVMRQQRPLWTNDGGEPLSSASLRPQAGQVVRRVLQGKVHLANTQARCPPRAQGARPVLVPLSHTHADSFPAPAPSGPNPHGRALHAGRDHAHSELRRDGAPGCLSSPRARP